MGEDIKNTKFTIKDDGTIVRGRKCPKCGRELISDGDYCEYCGAKIEGTASRSTPKKGGGMAFLWLLFGAILIAGAIVAIISVATSNNYEAEWYDEPAEEEPVCEDTAVWIVLGEDEVSCENACEEAVAEDYDEAAEWSDMDSDW